jgi:hypothetical protein
MFFSLLLISKYVGKDKFSTLSGSVHRIWELVIFHDHGAIIIAQTHGPNHSVPEISVSR